MQRTVLLIMALVISLAAEVKYEAAVLQDLYRAEVDDRGQVLLYQKFWKQVGVLGMNKEYKLDNAGFNTCAKKFRDNPKNILRCVAKIGVKEVKK